MPTYEIIMIELLREFPKFMLMEKHSSVPMRTIDAFLRVITLGMMKTFMTDFITTVGYKVYVPTGWERMDRVGVLRHERVHMRQMRKYGRVWFTLSYLFLWLPLGLAYFRRCYEQEAYAESMRHTARTQGIEAIERAEYRERMISHFTTAQYFWTWPFRKSIEQ
jgi:hypothetical protein